MKITNAPSYAKKIISFIIMAALVLPLLAAMPAQASEAPPDAVMAPDTAAIRRFVTRLYIVCLSREPDTAGLENWTRLLESGEMSGAEVAQGFMFSQEMADRFLSYQRFVEILYNAMLGRTPDLPGKTAWLSQIEAGMSLFSVFEGFARSPEFQDICGRYGIRADGDLHPVTMPPPSKLIPPLVFNGQYNPLTGEPLYRDIGNNRPWAVTIGNTSAALPLIGIGNADIICEFPIESGETRFLALYQDISEADLIVSVRSLRTSSMEIAAGFDSIFAHWLGRTNDNIETAGSPISRYGTFNAAYIGGRYPDKPGTHDAYVTGKRLLARLPADFRTVRDDASSNTYTFAADAAPEKGLPAGSVTVNFSAYTRRAKEFAYNEADRQYYATHIGRDLIDGFSGERLGFTNIIVIKTEMAFRINESGHTYIKTAGSGEGYFICGGKYTEMYWSRAAEPSNSPYRFFHKDGSPLTLGVGKSFICFTHEPMEPVFR